MNRLKRLDDLQKQQEQVNEQMRELATTLTALANSLYGSPGKSSRAAVVLYSLAGALRDDERAVEELARIAGEFSRAVILEHERLEKG